MGDAVPELTEVRRWLTEDEIRQVYSSAYWNDVEEEQKKDFWIEHGNYEKCRNYLDSTKLLEEYRQAEPFIHEMGRGGLRVADLAAGIGWTSALLSKLDVVAEVHAVEISKHRLDRLFPHCVAMFAGRPEKISRYLGSFYHVKLPDASMDVVLLSHAFHHSDRPKDLLAECDRILKPRGRIIVVGEHRIGLAMIVRRFLGVLLRERKMITDFRRLFPPDPLLGDHYYRRSDYEGMFGALGYDLRDRVAATGYVIYVAEKGG